MGSVRIKVTTKTSGPLFDHAAAVEVTRFLRDVKQELGAIGRDWIRLEAETFDKSGRGGTGRAAAEVVTSETGATGDELIRGGSTEGQVWWPWLEGTSKRNDSTRFKGYHTFRRVASRLRSKAGDLTQRRLDEFITLMGGHSA